MLRVPASILAGLLVLGLAGCGHNPADAGSVASGGNAELTGKLVLTGSSTVAPLASEIARRFESMHPMVRIDVQTGGSSRGIADTRRGLADIGMASRALADEEADLTAVAIAMDGVGLVVHRDNPVAELTDDQVVRIYTGTIDNWAEIGGRDEPITVVSKAEGRATLAVFLDHFGLESRDIRAGLIIGDNQQGIRTVAGDPNAIGYVSIGAADFEASRGAAIRLLPMNGVDATIANVRAGSFPMSRPLNLVVGPETSPLVRAFLDFARSSAVNDLVEAQFFVPIAE